ncbi:MAG: HPr family phosphocarrier protein [bacterium]
MKSFTYTITDPVGIHARPAGQLVKEVKALVGNTVTITKGDRTVNALKLMALMQMGIKKGDTITVSVEGPTEEDAANTLKGFFMANL